MITNENLLEQIKEFIEYIVSKDKEILAKIPGVVKEWGNSAHVPVQKKFIGHECEIIIKKEKVSGRSSMNNKESVWERLSKK